MAHQSGSSRTWSRWAFCTRRTNRWESIRVFGTPTIGQRGAVWWKQIGAKHRSLRLTGTSKPTLVFSPAELLCAHLRAQLTQIHGSLNSYTQLMKRRSNGIRRTAWFTITALIPRDFPKFSSGMQDGLEHQELNIICWHTHICIYICICSLYQLGSSILLIN